jgi:hypothetical protein
MLYWEERDTNKPHPRGAGNLSKGVCLHLLGNLDACCYSVYFIVSKSCFFWLVHFIDGRWILVTWGGVGTMTNSHYLSSNTCPLQNPLLPSHGVVARVPGIAFSKIAGAGSLDLSCWVHCSLWGPYWIKVQCHWISTVHWTEGCALPHTVGLFRAREFTFLTPSV